MSTSCVLCGYGVVAVQSLIVPVKNLNPWLQDFRLGEDRQPVCDQLADI